MPRDYKIGIIIGLLVLIAGVVYFVATGEDETQPQPQPTDEEPANQIVVNDGENTTGLTETDLPAMPEDVETTDDAATNPLSSWGTDEDDDAGTVDIDLADDTDPAAAAESGGWGTGIDETDATDGAFADTTEPGLTGAVVLAENADDVLTDDDPADAEIDAVAVRDTYDPIDTRDTTTGSVPADRSTYEDPYEDPYDTVEPIGATDTTATTDTATTGARTYTVTETDTAGFWGVSLKVYGNGKYYELIQDANPNIDSRALRPGMKLRIPPKPVETSSTSSSSASEQGKISTNAAGQKIYTVSDTDTTGFWGIAKKVYGKGSLHTLISQANPDVNSRALNPGTKLIIPPVPAEETVTNTVGSAIRAASARQGETIMEDGQRFYVVAGGDAGFWGIAKKVYGEGKYNYLLRDANPGVDSNRLQPGDRLRVPPLPPEAERRERTTRPVDGGVIAEPVRDSGRPVPVFD